MDLMMRPVLPIAAAMLSFWVLPALAAKGDPVAGQAKAEVCLSCHGEKGISEMAGIPSLAGQQDQFLEWQLVFFRSGRRKNDLMSPMAADLTDADIRNLGVYFASLPSPAAQPPVHDDNPALHEQGAKVAEAHHCATCHTDGFTGKAAAASLAHQREDYLVKALTDYRADVRPSTGVAAMTEAAAGLSDTDIAALAHFLATVPAATP
jgi:cytochrome c553